MCRLTEVLKYVVVPLWSHLVLITQAESATPADVLPIDGRPPPGCGHKPALSAFIKTLDKARPREWTAQPVCTTWKRGLIVKTDSNAIFKGLIQKCFYDTQTWVVFHQVMQGGEGLPWWNVDPAVLQAGNAVVLHAVHGGVAVPLQHREGVTIWAAKKRHTDWKWNDCPSSWTTLSTFHPGVAQAPQSSHHQALLYHPLHQ